MPLDRLVSDRKSGCYVEVGCRRHQNCCDSFSQWKMENLTVKVSLASFMTVTMHGRGKKYSIILCSISPVSKIFNSAMVAVIKLDKHSPTSP